MDARSRIETFCSALEGVVARRSWGETAYFVNPGRVLPHGVYFCTIKDKDGAHDRASALDREGVFRVSIGVPTETYAALFGPRPARPGKGGVVATGHDHAALDALAPHPVYAWMGWVQILAPSVASWERLRPLIVEAHGLARLKFAARLRRMPHDRSTQRSGARPGERVPRRPGLPANGVATPE